MLTDQRKNNTTNADDFPLTDDFLPCGYPSHKDEIKDQGNEEIGNDQTYNVHQHVLDIEQLSATELRNKYPKTYKAWDNTKQKCSEKYILNPEFENFVDFFRHVGSGEDPLLSLDRINNDDLEYGPGKVKWRDRFAQNSNKGNNSYLTHDNGESHTVAEWARITDQKPGTLYNRKNKLGWSDMEIITGKRINQFSLAHSLSEIDNPWPFSNAPKWENIYIKTVVEEKYKRSRIEFLHEEISVELRHKLWVSMRVLELAIEHKDDFPDYMLIPGIKNNVIIQALNEYLDTPLSVLEEELQKIRSKIVIAQEISRQTEAQISYFKIRAQVLDNIKDDPLSKEDRLKYFDSKYSRPEYTINVPPEDS